MGDDDAWMPGGRAPGLPYDLYPAMDRAYALHLPPESPWGSLVTALGLPVESPRLWPSAPCREEAREILAGAG